MLKILKANEEYENNIKKYTKKDRNTSVNIVCNYDNNVCASRSVI